MRDIIRRIWRWVFGPRYYVVRAAHIVGGIGYVVMSHAEELGGCPNTGVFDDYNNAMRYWYSRAHDSKDPGLTYTIKDVTDWEYILDKYFHYNPEKRPCR
jgi:hypothetical protein